MKKILSVILVLSMLFGMCSLMVSAESGWTLSQMQAQFPHGKYWNHLAGSGHYYNNYAHSGNCGDVMMTVTDHPCYSHNANAAPGQYDCNTYYGSAIQCCGFARLLADLAYPGATDVPSWSKVYDKGTAISVVKPGDVIHYKGGGADATWGHWVFVIGVSGSTVTLGECNVGDKCNIYWGRTFNLWNASSLTLYRAPYQWNGNVILPNYDVNGNLDGNALGATTDFATFDVYVGGNLVADDVSDYNKQHAAGTAFEIKDIKPVGCHEQAGEPNVVYGSDGSITVTLNFKTSHTLNDGEITKQPTCTEKGEKTVSCVNCSYADKTEVEPLGHDYKKTKIDATCTENAKFVFICSRCNHSYVEAVSEDDIWSEWSEEKPNVAEDKIETKTQYRYMQRETKVTNEDGLVGWIQTGKTWSEGVKSSVDYVTDWHRGFDKNNALYNQYNKSVPTPSETDTLKVEVGTPVTKGYIYWHWCSSSYNGNSPINRYINDSYSVWDNGTNRAYDVFHAFFSTEYKGISNTGAVDFYNSAACNQTYWWQPAIPVMSVPVTTYEMMFEYYKDTEYSEWVDELPELPENTRTETRTLYRYVVADDLLKGHNWDDGTVQGDMTVYTCSACGETKSEKYENGESVLGDVNADGKVNAADARIVLRASAKLTQLNGNEILSADVNGDGKVNASDARIILRVAAKLQEF